MEQYLLSVIHIMITQKCISEIYNKHSKNIKRQIDNKINNFTLVYEYVL